jgi:large subunit ribosomal protein L18e
MARKPTGPSNIWKRKLARMLWKTKISIWRDVSERLMAPARQFPVVNLYRLAKITKKGETVVIPGKVLAVGQLTEPITIACYAISKEAVERVKASGSKLITIEELIKQNPKGSGVKIIV